MRMGKSGEKGYMGSMEKQPSSLTAHIAAAATVIANIDVFSTASFQIHSLGFFVWGFFFTLYSTSDFHIMQRHLAEKCCVTSTEISQ